MNSDGRSGDNINSPCAYHPEKPAVIICEECKRPVCADDHRIWTPRIVTGTPRERCGIRPGRPRNLCLLCHARLKACDSSNSMTVFFGIAFLSTILLLVYTGLRLLAGTELDILLYSGGLGALIAVITLLYARYDNKTAIRSKRESTALLQSFQWKHTGDAEVSTEELLEMTKNELENRTAAIYRQLATPSDPDIATDPALFYLPLYAKPEWKSEDMNGLSQHLLQAIDYWSLRPDLTKRNKGRTVISFTLLITIRHIGKEQALELFKTMPFYNPDTFKVLLPSFDL